MRNLLGAGLWMLATAAFGMYLIHEGHWIIGSLFGLAIALGVKVGRHED